MKKWIILFDYPMDHSTRSIFVDTKEDVALEMTKYTGIRYFIAAFAVEEGMVNTEKNDQS